MANGFGHECDVFVSYAHADNEKPLGSAAQYGWVTTLAHNLNTGPGHYRKNLFIDHQLKPGDPFSDDLLKKGRKQRPAVAAPLAKLYRFHLVREGTGPFHPHTCQ